MGDKENTLRYLQKAYRDRSWSLLIIKTDSIFDFLRSDSPFQSIEKDLGLIPNAPHTRPIRGKLAKCDRFRKCVSRFAATAVGPRQFPLLPQAVPRKAVPE